MYCYLLLKSPSIPTHPFRYTYIAFLALIKQWFTIAFSGILFLIFQSILLSWNCSSIQELTRSDLTYLFWVQVQPRWTISCHVLWPISYSVIFFCSFLPFARGTNEYFHKRKQIIHDPLVVEAETCHLKRQIQHTFSYVELL